MQNILRLNQAINVFNNPFLEQFDTMNLRFKEKIYNILEPINIINSFNELSNLLVYKLERLTNYYHSSGTIHNEIKSFFDLNRVPDLSDVLKLLDGMAFISLINIETQEINRQMIVREIIKSFLIIERDLGQNNKKITLDEFAKYVDENKLCNSNLTSKETSILFQALCCLFMFKYYNNELKRAFRLVNKIIIVEGADKTGKTTFIKKFSEKFKSLQDRVEINHYKYPKSKAFYNNKTELSPLEKIKQQELYALETYQDIDSLLNNQFNNLAITVVDRWFLSNSIYTSVLYKSNSDTISNEVFDGYLSTVEMLNNDLLFKYGATSGLREYFDIIYTIFIHDEKCLPKSEHYDTDNIEKMYSLNDFVEINKCYIEVAKNHIFADTFNECLTHNLFECNEKPITMLFTPSNNDDEEEIINNKVEYFIDRLKNINNDRLGENTMIKKFKNMIKQIKEMFDSRFKPTIKE